MDKYTSKGVGRQVEHVFIGLLVNLSKRLRNFDYLKLCLHVCTAKSMRHPLFGFVKALTVIVQIFVEEKFSHSG